MLSCASGPYHHVAPFTEPQANFTSTLHTGFHLVRPRTLHELCECPILQMSMLRFREHMSLSTVLRLGTVKAGPAARMANG